MNVDILNKRFIKESLISIISLFVVVGYPCLFMYFNNADEAKFQEVWILLLIFFVISIILTILLSFIFRSISKSTIFVNVSMLIFLNFAILEKIIKSVFQMLYYWHIALICIFILINFAIVLIYYIKNNIAFTANNIVTIVFTSLIIINLITAIPTIINKLQSVNKEIMNETIVLTDSNNKPNIYYLMFDEYGGLDCLKRYCDYDNEPFYKSMQELGFNISRTSHNEEIDTTVVYPNLLNLNYVNKIEGMSASERIANMKQPLLYKVMKENNYNLNIADSTNFLDKENSTYFYNPGYRSKEGSAKYYILQNTAYYPFYKNSPNAEIEEIHNLFNYVQESYKFQSNNLCTIGYFCFPHWPWFVDENGCKINDAQRMNWNDSNIYLGQLKYANKLITKMVNEIIINNPNSIIIIQSDHGYRQPVMLLEKNSLKGEELNEEWQYMTNIINMVYTKGKVLDIEVEGLSGINTLRKVLNMELNTSFTEIEN